MLSYQHGYHAGNRADVFKHAVLFSILQIAAQAQHDWLYLETHSAAGTYDLNDKLARKTAEADEGVLRLLKSPPSGSDALKAWLEFTGAAGPQAYPGSPKIALQCLRERDRMIFFEKHPAEIEKLKTAIGGDDRARALKEDGYNGALKLQPRRGERLLVFLDPSYETERDMDQLASWLPRAMKRWPKAAFLVWMPLFLDERELEFGQFISSLDYGFVAGTRWQDTSGKDSALEGSAIIGLRTTPAMARPAYEIAETLDSYW
ncbi:23S rRNA (adenine(2030)-N(6))-methyltransferase RlmJ [Henriciella marina]|uniref:23S rRNA (adenine(2030)-N(6))-methyltransferase RlmJ n=1 Tax=Henriciella marina TaxID=453851 RepID=UPI00035E02E3|nr:23S rRNA (adenine(2030)-N(6))-methyltransferase RlmJ [Henriciella marina]